MQDLTGKRYLIMGVANERSIAWAITKKLVESGAEVALTYPNDAIERRVKPLAESINCKNVYRCDVQSDTELDQLFVQIGQSWDSLSGVVHSLAFANSKDLEGRFVDTSRDGFKSALDISAYSLIAVANRAEAYLKQSGGSILTLSYLGSVRVVKNYNIMGVAKAALEASVRYLASDLGQFQIRVNAISAGPIKTLAAAGIPHFRDLLTSFAERAPLRRNVTLEDVANSALFYLGPWSSGVTGEVTYVDCGFSIMGL